MAGGKTWGMLLLAAGLTLMGCKKKEQEASAEQGPGTGPQPTQVEPTAAEPTGPASPVPAAVERSAGICAGSGHTCVMKASGEVLCTGENLDGQLGDDTARSSDLPVPVKGLTDAVEIACGPSHTCARRADGTVVCWGQSYYGQLGNGSMEPVQVPVPVEGLSGVRQIAAGYRTTCAVLDSGKVRCWGDGRSGLLARAEETPSASPVEIPGLEGIAEVSVGPDMACARKESGEVLCWGEAGAQLGRGDQAGVSGTPAPVVNLTGAKHLAVGTDHACAATDTGVFCWGGNRYGQLGNNEKGSGKDSKVPVQVADLTGVRELVLRGDKSCAVLESGAVQCWGNLEQFAKLVDLPEGEREAAKATAVKDLSDIASLTLGMNHNCAVRKSGQIVCWGTGKSAMGVQEWNREQTLQVMSEDVSGLAGEARERYTFEPSAQATLTPAPSLAAGNEFVCALRPDGRIACFGGSGNGELGCGTTESRGAGNPCIVSGISDAVQVSAALHQVCALRANGQVACWGDLSRTRTSLPLPVSGLTDATQIAVGGTAGAINACAVRADKTVACWTAWGQSGLLPRGSESEWLTAVAIPDLADVVQVAVGHNTACARRADGKVLCWGDNRDGALGQPLDQRPETPMEVPRLSGATHLAGFGRTFCAVHSGGKLSCWGDNENGQIGNGEMGRDKPATSPTEVQGVRKAVASFVGVSATCALLENGEAMCWGSNPWNQCGVDDRESRNITTARQVLRTKDPNVGGWRPFIALATGLRFGCALHADGNVSCWGDTPITPPGNLLGTTAIRSGFPVPAAGLQLVFPSTGPVAFD